jgi:hypothetical protein
LPRIGQSLPKNPALVELSVELSIVWRARRGLEFRIAPIPAILEAAGTRSANISYRRLFPHLHRCLHREKDMSASDDKKDTASEKSTHAPEHDEHMEDEEKILAGRKDVNYPAMLTKDVPGG